MDVSVVTVAVPDEQGRLTPVAGKESGELQLQAKSDDLRGCEVSIVVGAQMTR